MDNGSERDRLILAHLPQVRLSAARLKRLLPSFVSLEDLVSAGTVGLLEAVDRYEPQHGAQLNTYAEHRIRGAMLDSIRRKNCPHHGMVSLDTALEDTNLEKFFADSKQPSPEDLFLHREQMRLLTRGMCMLTPRERAVFVSYYAGGQTLRQIAGRLNVHLTRVSQLRLQAEERLRSYLRRRLTARPRADRRGRRPPTSAHSASPPAPFYGPSGP